ncbi:hypothetical protein FQN54_000479 [Arachnomyces sp. PD_36]|nr:hypothetical protein FQN54_000479 [Arachnomyces sp. PD_36]
MSGLPDEDDELCDSRTASFNGQTRSRNGGEASQSDTSGGKPERKRARRNGDTGGSASRNQSAMNSREASSASSSQESESDNSENESQAGKNKSSGFNPPYKRALPAVQWNKGSKTAIRTTLGGKKSASGASTPSQSQTKAVGDQSQSRSVSISGPDRGESNPTPLAEAQSSGGTTKEPDANVSAEDQPRAMSISDGSESGEITEGDDDIVLNLSGRNEDPFGHNRGDSISEKPQQSPNRQQEEQMNGHVNGSDESRQTADSDKNMASSPSKEDAIRSHALKYRSQPTVLADLSLDDLEVQAKYFFYQMDIRDIDLSLPIRCLNCRKEGHLTEVCPDKECEHCGAWERHESSFCPSWRRCQKCRERGHDKEACTSRLMGSAMEVPCDRCGSKDHLENDCDLMWKSPWPHPAEGPITVSISCGNCTSRQHLIGDCPNLRHPMTSSSWTLKCYDPSMISEPSFLSGGSTRGGFRGGGGNRAGMRIRGRADARSPSPESDDLRSGPRHPIRRDPPRTHIRFDPGIGRRDDRYAPSQGQDYEYDRFQYRNETRDEYRDRDDFVGNNTRQRSLSPDPRPANRRGRGDRNGDNRRPPPPLPREPPPSRGRGQRARGKFALRNQGKRSQASGGGGDAYRPLPGAAKKAWDKHRVG